jgi:penicillin-binding protein 1B
MRVLLAAGVAPIVVMLAAMLEAGLRARLGPDDFLPATRFFARPLVLRQDSPISPETVDATLARLDYRRVPRRSVAPGEYYRARGGWIIGRRAFRVAGQVDPGGTILVAVDPWREHVRSIRDDEGHRLQSAALEPELLRVAGGPRVKDRMPVALSEVPQHLVDAVLTIEDQRFFEHRGVDLRRIGGAALANFRAADVVEGASTITQQLAKNLFLSPQRSILRKVREVFMAFSLEERYDKEALLTAYLNEVYLGQDGAVAIHGVGRAAQFYFGTDVSDVGLSQAALLAGIIRGPNLYSPLRHPKRARERRNLVLRLMHERGLAGDDAVARATSAPLGVREPPDPVIDGRYFVDFTARELARLSGDAATRRGQAVFTTLDVGLQRAAERAVERQIGRLERDVPSLGREHTPLQAALVAVDPATGEVLAMVGGRDYGTSQFNRAAMARRQPGSAFKPIVATAALRRAADGERRPEDHPFTLATVLEDEPLSVSTPAGEWRPVNYDGRYRGPITLREALERSLNVPFARLGLAIGPERIVATARELGIAGPLPAVPSLALGAAEVTPLEMARAYGVLAADGVRAPLNAVFAVADRERGVTELFAGDRKRVITPEEAYLVTSALRGAVERGTGRGLRSRGYHGQVAAKSGTTNDFRDGWFIGYTPTIAIAVWVGFDDGRSLDMPGARVALPIFADFLVGAFGRDGGGTFRQPWDLDVVEIDPQTGLRAGPGCRGRLEVFLPGTAPEESCSPLWSRFSERDRRSHRSRGPSLVRELLRMLERGGR